MEQLSLFDDRERTAPLASRLRPDSLEDFVGQEHLVGKRKILRQLIERDQISSMIFWDLREWEKRLLQVLLPERRKQSLSISAR